MNHAGKITAGLAGLMVLNASMRADDAALPGNPYAVVVARNIFGLNPTPPVTTTTTVEPSVKITPNGIMSISGQLQALFKVSGKPGTKEAFYNLSVGQRQDDIEVTEIDEQKGIVTFNNHGLVQELPLADAPKLTTSAAAPASPGVPILPTSLRGRGGNLGARGENGGNSFGSGGDNGSNMGNVPTHNNAFIQRAQPTMTRAESIVAMEVNRELTKQEVIEGKIPPLPPTEITPPDATSVGGNPLVAPGPGGPGQP